MMSRARWPALCAVGRFCAKWGPMEEDLRPEQGPPAPEDSPLEPDDIEAPPYTIDPALMYIIAAIVTLLGLNTFAVEIRYAVVWTALAIVGAISLVVDHIAVEPLNLRDLVIGIGFGALVGLPVLAVGAAQLQKISLDIFGSTSPANVFHILVFSMPLAETVFFRGALQTARGPIFTGIAGGVWMIILFFPQLNVLRFPLVAGVMGLAFLFINILYSYVRHRAGFFASWTCQITLNLLLLFAARFIA
jgi:hypothetical protein